MSFNTVTPDSGPSINSIGLRARPRPLIPFPFIPSFSSEQLEALHIVEAHASAAQDDAALLGRSLGSGDAVEQNRRRSTARRRATGAEPRGERCCCGISKSLVSCRVSSAMDSACIFSSPQWRWWSFLPPSSFWLSLPFGPSRASELRAVPGRLCRLASRPSVGAENVNLISGTAGDRVAFLLGWSLGGELAQVDAVGHAGGNMWRRRPMVI